MSNLKILNPNLVKILNPNRLKVIDFVLVAGILNWILATGFWNDFGVWDDTANWID